MYIEFRKLEEIHLVHENLLQFYFQYRQVTMKKSVFVYFLRLANKTFKTKKSQWHITTSSFGSTIKFYGLVYCQ